MTKFCAVGISCTMLLCGLVTSASAMLPFKKSFDERYVENHSSEDFKKLAKKESCNICHVKGENKKIRNAYGNALAELIEGEAQMRLKNAPDKAAKAAEELKILAELEKAFEKVDAMKSDPKDESSPTYGELFKSGKLPESKKAE